VLLAATLLFAWSCIASLRGPEPQGKDPAVSAPPWLLALDDAYIFIRYAQQAARGLPLQWNPGEPSTGASSLLFTLPLIPVHWFSDNPAIWSHWSRIVGILSLWLLGLAAAAALRAAGVPEPWPLAGALAVVWSGPVGFGAVAGMESAANAALILLTCAAWSRVLRFRSEARWGPPLLLASLLPLMRPENTALTLLAVAAAFCLREGRRRWTALLALLPGALYALINLLATGDAAPAGALSKSWMGAPFLPAKAMAAQYALVMAQFLGPVYLGGEKSLLWFPAGLLAIATALAALWTGMRALRRKAPDPAGRLASLAALLPLAAAWAVLFLTAPLSSYLPWQYLRHHHGGLACAWVLATAGLALGVEALARRRNPKGLGPRRRALALLLPLLLLLAFPYWARAHKAAADQLFERHARAVNWLSHNGRTEMLLLNDAGLIALAHDGPMIDVMGLGTPDMTLPSRHGPGAIVETLARRSPLPRLAAVSLNLVRVPQLLGRPLVLAATPNATVVAEVRRDLLAGTPLDGPGVDFAYLPDEERARVRWHGLPSRRQPSFALLLPQGSGPLHLEGCRPVFGSVGLEVPQGTRQIGLRAALLLEDRGTLTAAAGQRDSPSGPALGTTALGRTAWTETRLPWPREGKSRSTYLWLTREGRALPCLESIRFFPG